MAISFSIADAQDQAITASYTYVASDDDSRNDARELCFLEAKRKLLKKAAAYLEGKTDLANSQLTKEQFRSYTAAVLVIEIANEDLGFINGQNVLTLTVKADVDAAEVRKRLRVLVEDTSLRQQVEKQRQELQQLEEQARQLSARLNLAPAGSGTEIRKERNTVLTEIHNLEHKMTGAVNLRRIEDERERQTRTMVKIRTYILRGMTADEVLQIMGPPLRKEVSDSHWVYEGAYICFSADQFKNGSSSELRVRSASTDYRCELDFLK
ncbi:MAG: hypothetical protein EPO64_02210 [Nitrospirae bacterium]|nr:MAG: hypothetical protein EPO64_02210 [Nitrospirota bacterium]